MPRIRATDGPWHATAAPAGDVSHDARCDGATPSSPRPRTVAASRGFLASPARMREDADVPELALVDVEARVARAIAEHKAELVALVDRRE